MCWRIGWRSGARWEDGKGDQPSHPEVGFDFHPSTSLPPSTRPAPSLWVDNLRDSGLLDVNDHPRGPGEWTEPEMERERSLERKSHCGEAEEKRQALPFRFLTTAAAVEKHIFMLTAGCLHTWAPRRRARDYVTSRRLYGALSAARLSPSILH